MEFFISSYESDDLLVQRLNMFEDSVNDTYLNPIREPNAVSKTFLFLLTQCTGNRCSPPDVPYCLFVCSFLWYSYLLSFEFKKFLLTFR